MSSDFTLMEEAGQFRAIVEKAEFSDHEGSSLDYEKGIQKNLTHNNWRQATTKQSTAVVKGSVLKFLQCGHR